MFCGFMQICQLSSKHSLNKETIDMFYIKTNW